ncbi:MAG TPA: FAD-binding protein [Streptosporangiaceae bacterium]|nr:FAD-binding protein [Streptosporangiaceae bacterium]
MPQAWDVEADVVVIGFGAAGAAAALEAAACGADVLVIDRFGGGGATALSGGVVYAGGGTIQQITAGVADSPEAMYRYLAAEAGDAVSEATLRKFCDGSAAMLAWLVDHGVPFEGSLCPDKTSYPTNKYYLYYSGSELSFADVAAPAPRGHRAVGPGTSGRVLYDRLAAAVRAQGARVLPQTRAVGLICDEDGQVTGVECLSLMSLPGLRGAPSWARIGHRVLHRLGKKPFLYAGRLGRRLHQPVAWIEATRARPLRVGARHGVVIAAGGFVANRAMMREHAPAYRGGLALGTVADDGSGIELGIGAGGATKFLDRISCWRFITPPTAFLQGLIVNSAGRRICDESRYGAAIGEAIVTLGDRRGWLFLDQKAVAQARHWRTLRGSTLWFQLLQALYLLTRARVSAPSVGEVAAKAGVDPDGLLATVTAYNAAAAVGAPDPLGKPAPLVSRLTVAPYSLIDLSIRPRIAYPAPMLTLGGLVVAEETGQVRRPDGSVIEGLYAAGRSAVGVSSRSYVSGLSLADCVFSGRRAGRHAAGQASAATAGVERED